MGVSIFCHLDVDLTPEIVNFSILTTEAVVKLTAIDDGVLEPSETVTLSLNILTDLGVKIGIPDTANVTILEAFTGESQYIHTYIRTYGTYIMKSM